jgi:2-polyprenyl-6-methoxyphenol hydroxylase-like FAD-dependent oxidoreductase
MDQPKVLIVGAGPTGLVLALWLVKSGVPVRIIDKSEGPGTTSRATIIHARNLEFYHQLGIDQIAISGGLEMTKINLWIRGKRAVRLELGDFGQDISPYPYVLIFPQDKQEQMLVGELEKLGVYVERNTELVSFETTDEGIKARIMKNGQTEFCATNYLAGCDGAHSTVRKEMGVGFEGGTYSNTFYVADIKADGPAANGEMHAALDTADFMIIFPMKGETNVRLVGSLGPGQEKTTELKWEDVNKDILARMRMDVKKLNWFSSYRVHHRVATSFRQKNIFLLGDAAHVHSPVGGQGMNTGIGDAINLAWKLAAVIKAESNESLLNSYEIERIPFARKLVNTTDRAFSFVTADGWLAKKVRLYLVPFIASLLFGFKLIKRFLFRTVSQTAIKYPQSFLSEGKAGKIQGGDRLPWVNNSSMSTGNFEPLKSRQWQVHCFGSISSALEHLFTEKKIPFYVFEWTDAVRKAGYLQNAIYIVRPDGYVGLADAKGDVFTISEYLSKYIYNDKSTEMEVHHHPDLKHKKKNFREYFLEFLMIFLAVTMGFIAENVREGISDRSKEKEYIESLVQDIKTDTAQAKDKLKSLHSQMFGMDTLEMLLTPEVNNNDSAVYICYRQGKSIYSQHPMVYSDRTITQLVSSGNMRLIKKQKISDRITEYYSNIKGVDAQKTYYIDYFHRCLEIFQEIYEFDSYHSRLNSKGESIYPALVYGKFHVAITNAEELKKFKSTIQTTKAIIDSYRDDIGSLNKQADSLIRFLKQEYSLDDN